MFVRPGPEALRCGTHVDQKPGISLGDPAGEGSEGRAGTAGQPAFVTDDDGGADLSAAGNDERLLQRLAGL